ncbi:SURF1 family protein [Methylobacterium sp. PvR107]|uniref:SURF1 family protein n=1 Tax=Methylobacterium sp. PvR107 TaxID=2806597 RepID=UPI001AE80151|nr:SURF1 family protein [Methylobacterium sp. PvR107]MBP1182684.1 surfeit locus 1 family protein [Methylobacterium sp. PvR107]
MIGSGRAAWRALVAPGLAALVALSILLGLGTWQLERKAWKEDLIARILRQSRAEPVAPPAPDAWNEARDEFRHVRVSGRFLNDRETLVHGLAAGETPGRALQGYYVLTPFARADGGTVLVNRGFVPTELKAVADRRDGLIEGPTTVTGILRASEVRTMFVPTPDPARGEWFNRDVPGIAAARGLADVAPYLIEADAVPGQTTWPRGGQLRVDLPNNHLQYAFTWFGLAGCLIAVFSVFAWRRLHETDAPRIA